MLSHCACILLVEVLKTTKSNNNNCNQQGWLWMDKNKGMLMLIQLLLGLHSRHISVLLVFLAYFSY